MCFKRCKQIQINIFNISNLISNNSNDSNFSGATAIYAITLSVIKLHFENQYLQLLIELEIFFACLVVSIIYNGL